jgi:hypothetical protein
MNALSSQHEMLRAAQKQSLYREVNEKITDLNSVFGHVASIDGSWVCECADPTCTETVQLTFPEYEALRSHPNRFAVRPGHVFHEVERVVEEHERYVIVEKLGAGASFAVENDPRARSAA